jgi:hypothetical protein
MRWCVLSSEEERRVGNKYTDREKGGTEKSVGGCEANKKDRIRC